ncbi:NAD(P)-dependent oxidoreductase [Herbiconiux sp. A18JL235]|uniref:NAD(P)-dependent oxidoreductase n=1 Tax=Herbiconiux sp. A18JL235 TaxID=3152363 RepID=A0AB39BGD7_9MICO
MSGAVLVTSRSFGAGRLDLAARVAEHGYRIVRASPSHDTAELAPLLEDAVGWIAGTGPVTEEHLSVAPSLRVVARYGVGVDRVDLAAAAAHGVVVTNTPGANSSAVVEHTMALLLSALRGIPAADRRVRQGDWGGWRTRELSALAVGVVGLGRIGRGVVDRLRAFGPTLSGADPFVPDDDPLWRGLRRTSAAALAAEADVVSLHAPGGATIVDEEWLAASDRAVIVVNTARADLVDEEALASALRSGRVVAYAADTLATENHGSGASPLLADDLADRVTITPHLAAQTVEGVDGMGGMAVENLLAVLAGETPPNPVS